jgi:two-component system CheB/CheR fusion protein
MTRAATAAADESFVALLEFLQQSRGIDLSGYRRSSLERRFRRRVERVGCKGFGDYVEYLELHPAEYDDLFDTLLVNVTEFFRDAPSWDHLRREVLPPLIAAKREGERIRVWSAGCATGQEAYTLAMVLAELLGADAYRERVKVYATDVDEAALAVARQAVYTAKEVESVPPDLREAYFEGVDGRLGFRRDLRRTVIFGRNDLRHDAPISNLDVLVCRNTLLYMTPETQARIVRSFHFALREGGVLMLGKSEMLTSERELFGTLDLKRRLFVRHAQAEGGRVRVAGAGQTGAVAPFAESEQTIRALALDAGPVAQLVVSHDGVLRFANLPARTLFGIGAAAVGRPFRDLDVASTPAELRQPTDAAMAERRQVDVGVVRFTAAEGDERTLDVSVVPLLAADGAVLGAAIRFEDATRWGEVENQRRDLENAYDELQATIDELESANEELETTNEELETTNEELETMNEELRSANEELQTTNDELRNRTGELHLANDFLGTILASLRLGVAVVDRDGRVQVWNKGAEELWGLRQTEALEQDLLALDIGLPAEQVTTAVRAVLDGGTARERMEIDAVDRRGRPIVCVTTVLPLAAADAGGTEPRGAIVLMERSAAGARGGDT